jgi:hypothetical protein
MLAGHLIGGRLASGWLGESHPGLPFTLAALCGMGTMALASAIVRGIEPQPGAG